MSKGGAGGEGGVRKLAARLVAEAAAGALSASSHSERLDLAARLCGFQSWHEAAALDAKAARKAPRAARGGRALVLSLAPGAASRSPALLDGPGGLRVDLFEPKVSEALLLALRRLVSVEPPAPGWTDQGWKSRAGGLIDAIWPAVQEGAAAGAWAVDAATLRRFVSWDGISELRSEMPLSDASRSHLREWAKPWHSSYAGTEDPSRAAFEPVSRMWTGAIDWLASKASQPGPSWFARSQECSEAVKVEASWRPMALASALFASEGVEDPRVVVSGLSAALVPSAVRWFEPETPPMRIGWRAARRKD